MAAAHWKLLLLLRSAKPTLLPPVLQQVRDTQGGEDSPSSPQINNSMFNAVRLYLIGSNENDYDDQTISKIKITSTYSSLFS